MLAWFVPNITLNRRAKLVENETEEDFLQIQTIMTILCRMSLDTLRTLKELAHNSVIHKDMLTKAYHGYPSNPEYELRKLKDSTPMFEFKQFINRLSLTSKGATMEEAFSDLILERDHIMKLREMSIKRSVENKRSFCGRIAMLPFYLLILDIAFPIVYLGITDLMSTMTMLGGL